MKTHRNKSLSCGLSSLILAGAILLGLLPTSGSAGIYKVAFWYEVGAHQNQAPPAGEFGNHSAHIHVWNEDGSPRSGVDIYTSWGVLLGATDQNGYMQLELRRPNGYDFEIRDGSNLSETTPILSVERPPSWGHYSFEIGFLLVSDPGHSVSFQRDYAGILNASGSDPCRDLSAPGTLSLAYRSTPTNYCGDAFDLGNWVDEHGQTFVATGNRIVAAKVQGTIGYLEHMNYTAQILDGGPNGTPLGPPATSRTMVSDEYFPILVKWDVHDVQVVPGRTYYLKITRGGVGLNAYQVGNTYSQGQYYENGIAQPNKDLVGLVTCLDYVPNSPTGAVLGAVRDPSDNPIQGATVTASPGSLYSVTTGQGVYSLLQVPVGLYSLTAAKTGFISQTIPGVSVSNGMTTRLDFSLLPQPTNNGRITGWVVDPPGHALEGVRLTVYPTNLSLLTGSDGRFLFPSIPFGSYRVVASKVGFASAIENEVLVTNGQTTSLHFALDPQVLRNGNFESGFTDSVGDHWTKFRMADGNSAAFLEESQQKLGGLRAQRWWSSYGTHHAGIYQQVPVLALSNYTFSAWTWRSDAWDNGGINQEMWVGIDPFGGTDPNSGNVLWSNGEHSYRTWTRQSATTQARTDRLTVFVRGQAHFSGSAMVSVVDDALLRGPFPTPLGLVAQPENRRVVLSWYENVPGAAFHIKRALAEAGPYATLAQNLHATSYTDESVVNGITYYYRVSSVVAGSEGPDSPAVSATPTASVRLVSFGAEWKYLDDGSDPGAFWSGLEYNDDPWPSGPARLGYGGDGELTTVDYGPDPDNKHITTCFRHSFDVTDPSLFADLRLNLVRDDGGIVYLNGAEVFRSNMPDGPITPGTWASSTVGGGDELAAQPALIQAGFLVSGMNCLAVEIHQASPSSSDLGFDLELTGHPPPEAPVLFHRRVGNILLLSWQHAPEYVLQRASGPSPESDWATLTSTQTSYMVIMSSSPSAFYRLARP